MRRINPPVRLISCAVEVPLFTLKSSHATETGKLWSLYKSVSSPELICQLHVQPVHIAYIIQENERIPAHFALFFQQI